MFECQHIEGRLKFVAVFITEPTVVVTMTRISELGLILRIMYKLRDDVNRRDNRIDDFKPTSCSSLYSG